jgi:purine-binding chemotaxis protein CheW
MEKIANQNTSIMTNAEQLVTVFIEGQLLGFPIGRVRDVFALQHLTVVPSASNAVAGLVNLRGRVVTMLSLRVMLGFAQKPVVDGDMAIGIECKDDAIGLIVDQVGEVIDVDVTAREDNPANIDARWSPFCLGIHKLENSLLVELDLNKLLERSIKQAA